MRPGAQIAVQVPQNDQHPSHRLAHVVAQESPFRELLGGFVRETYALSLERYAEILYAHGLHEQTCIEKIYGHEMASTHDVPEWVKGTMLTAYLSKLDEANQAAFLAAYTERLLATLGEHQPYFYPFRRLLFWAQKPA
jgi:trans-aconitate 2-methyltransferase